MYIITAYDTKQKKTKFVTALAGLSSEYPDAKQFSNAKEAIKAMESWLASKPFGLFVNVEAIANYGTSEECVIASY